MKFEELFRLKRRKYFGTRSRSLYSLWLLAFITFIIISGSTLFLAGLFVWYAKDLPRPDKVKRSEGLSTVILDRNGENLYDLYEDANRIPADFESLPQHLKNATIAIEDKDFYKHIGLSQKGILRAVINIFIFRNFQGGSTLTQQLVKNALLTQDRTLPRKIKEAILAVQIERKYTKDEILLMYLNETPYGSTAVGAEAAAQYYFAKPVQDLGLVESAILAGLPQSPTRYSPFTGDDKAYVYRTEQVLRRMREDGYITSNQEEDAKKQLSNVVFAGSKSGLKAPHFTEYIKELLVATIGQAKIDKGGYKVTTTLDINIQKKAQQIVAEEVEKAKKLKVSNGAAVVIDPKNGDILAMVGSKDYESTDSGGYKYNVAVQGLRQPGSAVKPFTYATALKKGFTASTMLMDVETKYPSGDPDKPEYNPKNYDGKYRGPMQMRYALSNSINTIAVKFTALVGIKDMLKTAYDMGLTTLEPTDANMKKFGLSITLGGAEVYLLDLTSAFGTFAAGGLKTEPRAILKIEDAKGQVIFEPPKISPKRVLDESIAFIISNILSDNEARKIIFGERSLLYIPQKSVAVKTGTTDDKRDNWTVGYTKSYSVGVWVGNNDNSPMHSSLSSGITGASPIWNRIMKMLLEDKADEPFTKPDSVVEVEIDSTGGGLPVEGNSTRKEFFIKGTEPIGPSEIYKTLKISRRDSNKLANQVEIVNGDYDNKIYIVIKESDPVSTDGTNRWQAGIDAWLNEQTDSKYKPPTDVYEGDMKLSVRFKNPSDMDQINSNSIDIRIEAAGQNSITKIEVRLDNDDKIIIMKNDREIRETINIPNGSHIIRARTYDDKGNSEETRVKIGINEPYHEPTSTPTPSSSPVPTATATLTITPSP